MCDRYGVDREGALCGHGVCIRNDCQCDEGWTSAVDFWPDPHFDCDTSSGYIVATATIILVLHIGLALVEFYCVAKTLISRKPSSIWNDKGRMFIHWGLGSLGSIVYAYGLISGGVVGTSAASSVGFAIMWAEMFCGWACFNSQVISFLKKSSNFFTPSGREAFIKDVEPFLLLVPYFEVLGLPIPAIIVLVYNIAPDSAGKALIAFNIYVSISMAVDAYVCAVTCASFRTNIKTLIVFGTERNASRDIEITSTSISTNTSASDKSTTGNMKKDSTARLKSLSFLVRIVQLFASAFGLLATPFFIVFAASPFMRHKVMWTHLMCFSCAAFPQFFVLLIFMPPRESGNEKKGGRVKSSNGSDSASSTSKAKVYVSSEVTLENGPLVAIENA